MSDRFITVIQKVDIGSEESIAYAGNDTHESKWEKIQLTVEYHLKNEGAKQQKYCYQYNADNQQCANNRPHECLHLLWILLIPEMLDTDIVIHAIIGGKLDKNGKGDIKCQLTIQCSGKIFCIGKQQHHTGQERHHIAHGKQG